MPPELSAEETRIIGCLIEKSLVTPDQYPLTLNALTNACNQKSARNPVMNLTKGEVQRACRQLEQKSLLRVDENFRSSVEKYSQRLCNTRYSDYHFGGDELAVVCALLLRGPQTPGELRANTRRLHEFADNDAVARTLAGLMEHERGAIVVKLPRTPGRRDAEYAQLFSGPIDIESRTETASRQAAPRAPSPRTGIAELAERVSALEAEVAALKERLDAADAGSREATD